MNNQTKEFSQLLAEIYEKAHDKQDMTFEEIMDELKNKLSVLVEKERCK